MAASWGTVRRNGLGMYSWRASLRGERDMRITAEAYKGGRTHCFPLLMASPIVLWHFFRAISISSSAIVAS